MAAAEAVAVAKGQPPVHNRHRSEKRGVSSPSRNVLRGVVGLLLVLVAVALHQSVASISKVSASVTGRDDSPIVLLDILTRAVGPNTNSSFQEQSIDSSHITDITEGRYGDDSDCPFRDSPLYRKVFVYPTYGDVKHGWGGSILSEAGQQWNHTHDKPSIDPWPWLEFERRARENATSHFDIDGQHVQYTTELLVRELFTNPKSCLRTYNPEEATLFHVPYMPSMEFHQGSKYELDYSYSPYGQAIMDILVDYNESSTVVPNYTAWEQLFGLTSKYWKRRNGTDHILVFSEPMHGLWHPRFKRGNYHYLHSQKQLTAPIVLSVELSRSFVTIYPNCARKNILLPYPNTDGRWFNGVFDTETQEILKTVNMTAIASKAAVPSERRSFEGVKTLGSNSLSSRPASMFFDAGIHGTCRKVRRAIDNDYKSCSKSYRLLHRHANLTRRYMHGMRVSTFCPSPGGDSPGAKRMFDCCLSGSIPVVISWDFVWPFTNEFDDSLELDPSTFSINYSAKEFSKDRLDPKTCEKLDASPSLEGQLETIESDEIMRLRQGVQLARELYSWYRPRPDLPSNPLLEGVLPDGGTAHALVKELAKRASGARWPACAAELSRLDPDRKDPSQFKC